MLIIKLLFHPFFLDFTIAYLRRVTDSANEMAFPEISVMFGTLNQCPPWPLSSASPAWNSLGVSAGSCQDVPVWTFSSPWLLWWWRSSIDCASPTARPQGAETNLPPVSVRFPCSVSLPLFCHTILFDSQQTFYHLRQAPSAFSNLCGRTLQCAGPGTCSLSSEAS